MYKTETWLPKFPGFYESVYDLDYDRIEEDIKELIEDKELRDLCIKEFYCTEESTRVWEDWKRQITKEFTSAMEGILRENNFIEKINFQSLYSPREYNFSTDSINVEIEFSEENIKAIQNFLKENSAKWSKYLKERYSSRSGFISFHDNFSDSEEWIIDTDHALSDNHNFGSLLEFIIDCLELDDEYFMYFVLESCYVDLDIEVLKNEVIEKTGYSLPESVQNERALDKMAECPKLF